jgi:ankyrin repeat protein
MKLIILMLALHLSASAEDVNCPDDKSIPVSSELQEKARLASELDSKLFSERQTAKLFEAIQKNDLKAVQKALRKGANPNAIKDHASFISASSFAVRYGTPEILRALLDAGADPNLQDANLQKTTPLMQAAKWNRPWAVDVLLDPKYKTNINQPADGGRTPLHMAATNKNFGVLSLLVKNSKINLNASSVYTFGKGETVLSSLCFYSEAEGIKTLFNHPETTAPVTLENIEMAKKSVKGEKAAEINKMIDEYTKKHYP